MIFGKTKAIYFWAKDLNGVNVLMGFAKFDLSRRIFRKAT